MDSIYCTGTDVEMNRMFDQYLFKGPESFDLSLTIPDPVQENATNYMSADQTFHTPSFGDEEFEIPPISLPPSSMASEANEEREMNNQSYNAPVMTHSGMGEPVSVMTLGGTTLSSQPMITNTGLVRSPPAQMLGQQAHYSPHGIYLQSMGEGTAMLTSQANQLGSQSFDTRPTYTLSAHHPTQSQLLLQPQSASPSAMMGSTLLTTINQSQLGSQLGLQFMPQRAPSVNGSPPGSNQTSPSQETSEDSDDSAPVSQVGGAGGTTPLLQLMGGMKRPSPEPADNKNIGTKKPKVPKKKKKRDPNEPQKPVSAYALFFRDTQAAIKGQNPNASFGEVSKIVASMWDSLDAEHKNVYKKKTEAAKKEYLKALAAYRASLVSKQSTSDHVDNMYSSGASYGSNGSYNQQATAISSSTVSSPIGLSLHPSHTQAQQLSPLQKKSPLLTSLMEGSSSTPPQTQVPLPVTATMAVMTQSAGQQVMMASSISQAMPPIQQHPQLQPPQGTITTLRPPSQASSMGQPLQQHPPQQNTGANYPQQANYAPQQQTNISVSGGQQQQSIASPQGVTSSQPPLTTRPTTCLRNGCQNPAVESPDWDSEYCSNECVVSHCRDVFTAWVASRQTSNSFASVK